MPFKNPSLLSRPSTTDAEFDSFKVILRVVIFYALFSALWIPLSDRALAIWVQDASSLTTWQTVKGWLFVFVSALFIAWLLHIEFQRRCRAIPAPAAGERRVQKLNRIYAVLSAVNQIIVRVRDPAEFLPKACRVAVEIGGLRMAWIGLVDPETKAVKPVAHAGVTDGYLEQLNITLDDSSPRGRGPTASALRSGQPVIVDSVADDPRMEPWRDYALRLGYRSIVALPLISGGAVRGVITFYSSEPAFFDAEEVQLLDELAHDVAFALEVAEQERQRAEAERLRYEAEKRLRMAVSAGAIGLWDWDLRTNEVHFSPECKRQLGYADHELANTLEIWRSLLHPDDLARVVATVQTSLTNPWPDYRIEFRLRHKDGSYRWILAQAAVLLDEAGRPYRMLGAHIDVTPHKMQEAELEARVQARTQELEAAMEKAQTAERLKSTFLATVSHELRTPLNAILGFTHVLLQETPGSLNEEQKKQLGIVYESARHLLTLINDVLDISKIEAGQIELKIAPFDIREAVELVLRSVAPMAQRKGVELSAHFGAGVSEVISDRRRVEQILLNLLSNAVKFTERGSVTVYAKLEADFIQIGVQDTGIGIKEEDLGRLFRPFQQLDEGLTRRHEGTGLGLAICANLARLLGGYISVESQWGVGSTFTLHLPMRSPAY
ncbi:MAG: GAF domain-containing protein [Caldilinea sp.]|nr:GAF domain-containing protein [Caldilinea sp.]MDW8442769.1 GAF domain-containing protein [Caldilineaceae bacterium]